MSYAEKMQSLFHLYEEELGDGSPVELIDVANWALENGHWRPKPIDIKKQFKREMADALRQEYRTNEKGRSYRANHAVRTYERGEQQAFWADIDSAPQDHMTKAIGQRRQQVVGDCLQLRVDTDHYNEKHPDQEQIPLILDFSDDVEEKLIQMDEEVEVA